MSPLDNELKNRLSAAVGGEAVDEACEVLNGYLAADYPVAPGEILCAVKPTSPAQVRALVDLARKEGLNLVPVSSQAPHHKGGSFPAEWGVIVDLSGMDRVIRVDRRNRVALVEPGVTFEALAEQVGSLGLRVPMPLLPKAGKSVLASFLDRDPILIPRHHFDMTDPLLCTEIVFGTGDVFRTGSAAGPGSLEDQWALGNAQKNPMGPASSDLVRVVQGSQGTMGIVTWASVKLELEPVIKHVHSIQSESLEQMLGFARELMKRRLGDEILFLDAVALSAALGRGDTSDNPPFTMVFAIAGCERCLPDMKVAYQEADINDIAREFSLRVSDGIQGAYAGEADGLLSKSSPEPYWKRARAGAYRELFCLTTLDRCPELIDNVRGIIGRRGFADDAMGVYVQPIQQGRSCHLEFFICFDPGDDILRAAASDAVHDSAAVIARAGAFFSRPYEPWVGEAYSRCPDTVMALEKVKGVLDPDNVLNRGKLCFRGGETVVRS
ncbi:MAG TPA: FAD-binding oxidoreductase [Candidatus Anoxymicrobiaceae bacterium]